MPTTVSRGQRLHFPADIVVGHPADIVIEHLAIRRRQREREEPRLAVREFLRQATGDGRRIRRDIDREVRRRFSDALKADNLRMHLRALQGVRLGAHDLDTAVINAVLDVDRLEGLLHSVIAGVGVQVPVEELPHHGGPGGIHLPEMGALVAGPHLVGRFIHAPVELPVKKVPDPKILHQVRHRPELLGDRGVRGDIVSRRHRENRKSH